MKELPNVKIFKYNNDTKCNFKKNMKTVSSLLGEIVESRMSILIPHATYFRVALYDCFVCDSFDRAVFYSINCR